MTVRSHRKRLRLAGAAILLLGFGPTLAVSCSNLAEDCANTLCGEGGSPGGNGLVTPSGCIPSNVDSGISDTCGLFVSPTGSDINGDGTRNNPFRSLTEALAVDGLSPIYICAGADGIEAAEIAEDVEIWGGLDCDTWTYLGPDVDSAINGGPDEVALRIVDGASVKMTDVSIASANAETPGGSSIALFVISSELQLESSVVRAGRGAEAADVDEVDTPGPAGASGENAVAACSQMVKPGGEGGSGTCKLINVSGGDGGGSDSNGKAGSGPSGGAAGSMSASSCALGGAGSNGGVGTPGQDGVPATGMGTLGPDGYVGRPGQPGLEGNPGSGGGGGAGNGSNCGVLKGPAGGGGGSGGCGGTGGVGGLPGGASIGLASYQSSISLVNVVVRSDNGGAGSSGAVGQPGSAGGAGGLQDLSITPWACGGGRGGDGGRGGIGGGGLGGPSVAVATVGGTLAHENSTFEPGTPGQGGGSAALKGETGATGETVEFPAP